jgi:hypothetical protein
MSTSVAFTEFKLLAKGSSPFPELALNIKDEFSWVMAG